MKWPLDDARKLYESTKRVYQLDLPRRSALRFKELRGADNDGDALGARRRYVQAIETVEELPPSHAARRHGWMSRILATGGRTVRQVADDLGVGFSTLNKWIAA